MRRDPELEAAAKNYGTARLRVQRAGGVVYHGEETAMIALYLEARRLSRETGRPHHVDHIKPIADGGTHRLSNLQILEASEHSLKTGIERGAYWFFPIPQPASH